MGASHCRIVFVLAALVALPVAVFADNPGRRVARAAAPSNTQPVYDEWFSDKALRVDLFHTGTSKENAYSLDEIVQEPIWPGTRRYLVDPLGLGTYRLRVTDRASAREIFRQGYATLFDEWMGTAEALSGIRRSMSESVRFPCPKAPVTLHIDGRQRDGQFAEMFSVGVDPHAHHVVKTRSFEGFEVIDLSGGPPPNRALDVLIVAEGYAREDSDKVRADLKRFSGVLLDYEPWRSSRRFLHVRGIVAESRESGVTEPRKGIFRDTVLGASFNTFDSTRYLTVIHTKTLRQIAALAPYDALFVMVNSARYGGGGVYNQWSVFTSDNEYDDYVMLHEFGHHVAGLADEYYTSAISTDEDVMYPPNVEPWEPNITAFLGHKRDSIKWKELIRPATPLPTPEDGSVPPETVGIFEGAGYKAKNLYRPQRDCKMFHKGLVGFCQVCTRAQERVIHYYAGEDI